MRATARSKQEASKPRELGSVLQHFKLYGRARDVQEAQTRDAYRAAIRARIDWEPTADFHLFAIDIESAGFVVFGDDAYRMAWDPERGTRRWRQREE